MVKLYGKSYKKEELLKKTGSLSQICGFKEYTYNSGRAKGVDAIDVNTGDLNFSILSSRCLDIGQATYKGIPLGYISKSGLRNPQYFYENQGKGFLDSFYGGLLTTSGLNNIGTPCSVDGKNYGLHGEIANIPAEKISKREFWEKETCYFEVSGEVLHSRFYAEDFVLKRKITSGLGWKKIIIEDRITNLDYTRIPMMLLYHINLGFPLLDSKSKLLMPNLKDSTPRTLSAEKGLKECNVFCEPVDGIEEECFYHTFKQNKVVVCLFNQNIGEQGMGVYLKYDSRQLPVFLQWKMMRSREYVCGFAPATNYAEGRQVALENNELSYIEPGEEREFIVELGVIESEAEIHAL